MIELFEECLVESFVEFFFFLDARCQNLFIDFEEHCVNCIFCLTSEELEL